MLWLAGCQAARQSGMPLLPGQAAPGPAVGFGRTRTLARGDLVYAVAFADAHTLVSVELGVAFTLVVRSLERGTDRAMAVRERWRVPLGPADYDVESLAVDRGRQEAWVASRDGTVRAFALVSQGPIEGEPGRLSARWHLGSAATAVAVSPDGAFVATGTSDGVLCLRRRQDGALLQCVAAHQAEISKLDFAANASRLVSSSWTGEVVVWQVPSLAVVARRQFSGSANAVAFAPDAQRIAVALSAWPPRRMLERARSEERNRAQGGASHNVVAIWDLARDHVHFLRGHTGAVTGVAWTDTGSRLLTSSWDRTAALWDPAERDRGRLAKQGGFSLLVRDLSVAPNGALIAVAAWAKQLDQPTLVLVELLYRFTAETDIAARQPRAIDHRPAGQ